MVIAGEIDRQMRTRQMRLEVIARISIRIARRRGRPQMILSSKIVGAIEGLSTMAAEGIRPQVGRDIAEISRLRLERNIAGGLN